MRNRPDRRLLVAFGLAIACCCMSGYAFTNLQGRASFVNADHSADGANPHPVQLRLPPVRPLSAVAQLGKALFFDTSLSASGRQACASCHNPGYGYNPPPGRVLQPGGPHLEQVGNRPPPSLAYLYRQAPFSIGPDAADADIPVNLNAVAASVRSDPKAKKTAGDAPAAAPMVPQGGLFWDGRADSLQRQAYMPLLDPVEMANPSVASVARKLARGPYREQFALLFGPGIFKDPRQLVSEAMFAIGRFEIEDPSFHAFSSKYDAWLQGRARLTSAEMHGLELFNDPKKGNCAACHVSQPGRDGLPPLFTDTQYEALAVPRNPTLPLNRDLHFHDLGVCGPFRKDLARQTQYCGMFLTPTLRNVDRRTVFFHNGAYHSLEQVLAFYNLRSVRPGKVYPHDAKGKVEVYNDLPNAYWSNVDTTDAPFNRKVGDPPALTQRDIHDIIAFLHTLDDGYTTKQVRRTTAQAGR
ncbi:MAG: cytochrome-c peroxidase [Xanthomonadaceae bacterium]|nr:cytochrome-c peroxidase [Xanthomonadaceae bacterium]